MRDRHGYCCLGVMQDVIDGKVEPMALIPTLGWLDTHGIRFLNREGNTVGAPYLPSVETYASSANDHGMSFAIIADLIERNAQGT